MTIDKIEEATVCGLFNDEGSTNGTKADESSTLSTQNPSTCKILGYFLLSKPAFEKSLNPLTVGCVYYSSVTLKFYVRAKKLFFSP